MIQKRAVRIDVFYVFLQILHHVFCWLSKPPPLVLMFAGTSNSPLTVCSSSVLTYTRTLACSYTYTSPFRGTLKPGTSPLPVCQRLAQNMRGLVCSAEEGELCSLTEPTHWSVTTPGDRHPHSGVWTFVSKLLFFLCVSTDLFAFSILPLDMSVPI